METATLPVTTAFDAKNIQAYKHAVKEKNAAITMVMTEEVGYGPLTKGKRYPLKVVDPCGLVIVSDDGDHLHLEQDRVASALKEVGAQLRFDKSVEAILDEYKKNFPVVRAQRLADAFNEYTREKRFTRGMKVKQMDIHMFRYPAKDDYGIFLHYLDDSQKGRQQDAHDPTVFDCAIMAYDDDQDIRVFLMDSRVLIEVEEGDSHGTCK